MPVVEGGDAGWAQRGLFTAHEVRAGRDEKRARTPGLKLLGRGFVHVLVITVGLAGRIQQQLQLLS